MNKNEKDLNFKPAVAELHAKKSKRSAGTIQDCGLNDPSPGSNSQTASADPFVLEGLRQSEKRFRTVFEAAPLGIAIADPDGYFIETNNEFHRLLGYGPQEVKKLTFVDITHPDDRQETIRLSLEARSSAMNAYETGKRYLKKNGDYLWAIVRATAIRDDQGKLQYWLGIIEDITERKRATEALKESERRYRNILESIKEGYFEVDLKGNFTFFNDQVCRISGYSRAELIEMNNRQYTSPETARRMYAVFNQIYRTGRAANVTNHEIICKDGTIKRLEVSASLICDRDAEPIGFRGILRDVTYRKVEEKERKRLESQVQHAQKMEAIGTLAGGIAHDFNNLLMGFQGNISLMTMDLEDDHPHQEFLRNMENYVKRGSDLTRQILGFARGGKYEVKSTDINALIGKSADMFGRTKKEIIIHKKLQEDLWSVDADRGQIEQVLLNLFVNAWQAMPDGGNLFLQTENVTLEEHDSDKPYAIGPGKYVRISVSDTGVGMDRATRERIFEPFFTTKAVGRGTGLGLASAYGIIKNHGGIINVYSEKGHGATFRIYLPTSTNQLIKEKIRHEAVLTGSELILLVDDEEMVADIGKDMLEKLGYKVLVATGGNEAIKLLKTNRNQVDLVVLDMIMPDMSGGETFNRLRAIKPDIKILLSSGYSLNGRALEIMQRGCNGFIQKPFNVKQISRKIREILDA
jgi:two-component system, cell cycle sensor histidine kinase and response regulator CckA